MDGVITPIFKIGSKTDPENYRKVTFLLALGKLFEILLGNRLKFKNNVCFENDPFQAGFKASSRTADNIFVLYSLVQPYKKLKKPLYVCFIDFTKAFDYINRHALIYKLFKRNASGKTFKSCFGVIQGGVLSPQLFNEFLSDLGDHLDPECGVKLDKSYFFTYYLQIT